MALDQSAFAPVFIIKVYCKNSEEQWSFSLFRYNFNMVLSNKSAAKLHISENNRELLRRVLEAIFDEMPYSDNKNIIMLEHNGVAGDFVEYEKALILLNKLEVVENFQNTRYGNPVINGTVYAHDAFEITLNEEKLLKFNKVLSGYVPISNTDQFLPERTRVEPKSYDFANGILAINGKQVSVIKQLNKKGKLYESKQARLMRLVFSDVKGDFGTTSMRSVLSVREAHFAPEHRKLVKSYVSEINKKIEEEASVKDFLLTNQQAVMINEIYLK